MLNEKERRMYHYMKELFQDSSCGYKERCAAATKYSREDIEELENG